VTRKPEIHSSALPPIEKKPGKQDNWIERAGPGGRGGKLPDFIEAVARHIQAGGATPSRAVAGAITQIELWAAKGNAKAIAALAEWQKLKAASKAKTKAKRTDLSVPVKGVDGKTRWVDSMAEMHEAHRAGVAAKKVVDYGSGPSRAARARAQTSGQAFRNGRYPIRNVADLRKAIQAFGRATDADKPALKAFIKARARALGAVALIPETWDLSRPGDGHTSAPQGGHTKQYGHKKGDLGAKADWHHGYSPLSTDAFALKAKHLNKTRDFNSSGTVKAGKESRLQMPIPPGLQASKSDAARTATERVKAPILRKDKEKAAPVEKAKASTTQLRTRRRALEARVKAGLASAAEKKELNQVINEIGHRARAVRG
jgi:hypothetical protein